MKFNTYQRGDIIALNFDPSLGHEQQGYRLGLVWTNQESQQVSGFVSVFPITSHNKHFPLHVAIDGRAGNITGLVMTDQIITIDLLARKTKQLARADALLIGEVAEIFAEMTE